MRFLNDIAGASDAQVRRLVAEWKAPAGVTPAARQELADLLVNLTRGARFHTTQGTALSSYLRCERLIEQLVQNLQPVRRRGETLPGGWMLDAFLGMGSFGEVWACRKPLYPIRRALKVFTRPGAKEWLAREGKNALGDDSPLPEPRQRSRLPRPTRSTPSRTRTWCWSTSPAGRSKTTS